MENYYFLHSFVMTALCSLQALLLTGFSPALAWKRRQISEENGFSKYHIQTSDIQCGILKAHHRQSIDSTDWPYNVIVRDGMCFKYIILSMTYKLGCVFEVFASTFLPWLIKVLKKTSHSICQWLKNGLVYVSWPNFLALAIWESSIKYQNSGIDSIFGPCAYLSYSVISV